MRAARDTAAVAAALEALTAQAASGQSNLLDLAVTAIRHRATVGEVTAALEKVWGRYHPQVHEVHGTYAAAYGDDGRLDSLRTAISTFAEEEGRRPRILIGKLGQDGHDRGAKVIASAFADLGFDVDIGPLFQAPDECARQAIESDVHAVGISTLAAGHKTLVPELIDTLTAQGAADTIVFVGGVVPLPDHEFLYRVGVRGIYGPGTPVPDIAEAVLQEIRKARAERS